MVKELHLKDPHACLQHHRVVQHKPRRNWVSCYRGLPSPSSILSCKNPVILCNSIPSALEGHLIAKRQR